MRWVHIGPFFIDGNLNLYDYLNMLHELIISNILNEKGLFCKRVSRMEPLLIMMFVSGLKNNFTTLGLDKETLLWSGHQDLQTSLHLIFTSGDNSRLWFIKKKSNMVLIFGNVLSNRVPRTPDVIQCSVRLGIQIVWVSKPYREPCQTIHNLWICVKIYCFLYSNNHFDWMETSRPPGRLWIYFKFHYLHGNLWILVVTIYLK